jgi:RNA polymerase sigma factor (sigma-70 family)
MNMAGSRALNNQTESGDSKSNDRNSGPDYKDLKDRFSGRDDQSVWSAFKQNDEQAFIYIYQKHFHDLINYGHQFTHDIQLLEDCIQDIFIDLRRNKDRLTPVNSSIRLYLYKALKRRIIEYRRKTAKTAPGQIADLTEFEIVLPAETILIESQIREEQLSKLKSALSRLTERQREALFYLYHENLSYQQIQDLMGMEHVRSVRNLIYKAITTLRSAFRLLLTF